MADNNCFLLPVLMIEIGEKNSKVMGMDLTAPKQDITRWRHHWSIRPPDYPPPKTPPNT